MSQDLTSSTEIEGPEASPPDAQNAAGTSIEGKANWVNRTGRRVQVTLVVFVVSSLVAVGLNIQLSKDIGSYYTPMLDGVMHVKQSVTMAHLWLEDAVEQGEHANFDDVWWHMDEAEAVVRRILEGGQVHVLSLVAIPGGTMQTSWNRLLDKMQELRGVAQLRTTRSPLSEEGLELTHRYDALTRDVITFANHLEISLESGIAQNTSWLQKLQFLLIAFFLALLGVGSWFINTNFRRMADEVLHRHSIERALARSHKEAVAARDQAESAMRSRDQLLAKVSHEVRTPINAVMGLAHMLEDTKLDVQQRDYLRMLETETQGLLMIMEDLLDFSKIEAGKLALTPGPVDLRRLVADAVDLVTVEAEAKGLQVDIDLPAAFPSRLTGDPVRLRQVVLNLLNNAIKFTEKGHVTVGMSGHAHEDSGRYQVDVWVEDSGIGIPEAQRDHVFQPFAQADDSMSRRFGGTGLGLAICREIVHLMDGEMGYEPVAEGGSRFWFSVLLTDTYFSEPVQPDLAGRNVLLLDRDDRMRERTRALLEGMQATVEVSDDPAQGEALLGDPETLEHRLIVVNERLGMARISEMSLLAAAAQAPLFVLVRNTTRVNSISDQKGPTTTCVSSAHRAIDLPALLRGEAPPTRGTLRSRDDKDTVGVPAGLKVLLVDDHPVTQVAARHMLETLGCEVDSAGNGHEALEKWASGPYDTIFLDWQMPGMDGLEVAQRIRAEERASGNGVHAYLVAMTANAMTGDRERCLEAGMDEYIAKPVTPESFIRVLNQLPDQRKSA